MFGGKMLKKIIKFALALLLILAFGVAHADDTLFSTNLHAKFQVKACTVCHDFHEQEKNGLAFNSHAKRLDVNRCQKCHTSRVNSFAHPEDWFARPGLYLSGMGAKETCEKTKEALHAKFKSDDLLAAQMEKHLLEERPWLTMRKCLPIELKNWVKTLTCPLFIRQLIVM